jgi:hypothetical protein
VPGHPARAPNPAGIMFHEINGVAGFSLGEPLGKHQGIIARFSEFGTGQIFLWTNLPLCV